MPAPSIPIANYSQARSSSTHVPNTQMITPQSRSPVTCRPGVAQISSERRFVKGLGYVRADVVPQRTKYAVAQAKYGNEHTKNQVLAEIPVVTLAHVRPIPSVTGSTTPSCTSGSFNSASSASSMALVDVMSDWARHPSRPCNRTVPGAPKDFSVDFKAPAVFASVRVFLTKKALGPRK